MTGEKKTDGLIFWLMTIFCGILITGGGAWSYSMNEKAEKIVALEVKVQYIQSDISEIKKLLQKAINNFSLND